MVAGLFPGKDHKKALVRQFHVDAPLPNGFALLIQASIVMNNESVCRVEHLALPIPLSASMVRAIRRDSKGNA